MIHTIIIAANVIFSWMGFNQKAHFEKYLFMPGNILHHKEYIRLISSGFLHVDYMHLGLNMYVFWSFSMALETFYSELELLLLYMGSLLAGNLLALFIQRNNSDYRAVGASGAVSGIVFASILLLPQSRLIIIFFPFFSFPAWIFGVAYLIYTIAGIRRQEGSIGHEAHLGGAIGGLLITLVYFPQLLLTNPLIVAALLIPTLAFLLIAAKYPHLLHKPGSHFRSKNDSTQSIPRDTENHDRAELNRILEKIQYQGLDSLSPDERSFLDRYR